MRISHTQLDECRANPRSWVHAKASPSSSFPRYGYNQALLHAINRFHKSDGDAHSARLYLEESLDRNFENQTRSNYVLEQFEDYLAWCQQSAIVVADTKFRIRLDLGAQLELRGEMHRLDMVQNGYRGLLLGDYPPNWGTQLRMPLLQRAVALIYGRPVEEIAVGVQHLDGSKLIVRHYSSREIRQAEQEFIALSRVVFELASQYPTLVAEFSR